MNREQYLEHASVRAEKAGINVTLPTGAVFKMRPAPIQHWAAIGIIPASLVEKFGIFANMKDPEKAAKLASEIYTAKDIDDQQQLTQRCFKFCCLEPRVDLTGEDPEALSVEDLDSDDLEFLTKWMVSGGKFDTNLETAVAA